MDERGSMSIEAALVLPSVLGFIGLLIWININVFTFTSDYARNKKEGFSDYVETHRAVSAVFDAGENIYEILFG